MDFRAIVLLLAGGLALSCGGAGDSAPATAPTTTTPLPTASPGPTPASRAWAVGAIGGRGAVLQSADGGRSWRAMHLLNADDRRSLLGIAVADERTVVVVGDSLLMRSGDSGGSWTQYDFGPYEPRVLDAVAFADPSHGLAVGRSFGERDHDPTSPHPLFLITSDGGVTWARPTFPWEEYSFALRDVCMTARGTALIPGFGYAGELVAVSGDFGASWRDVTTDAAFSFGISVGAACLEDGNLWLVGYRSVLQSPDDGATWLAHAATFPNDVPVLDDVAFVDATRAFSIHRDVILSSTDPGVAWAREAQPYDGTEATFSGIAATRSTVLVGGSRAVSDGRIGIVLVRDLRQLGWSEAELPVGTDTITDVALAPLP